MTNLNSSPPTSAVKAGQATRQNRHSRRLSIVFAISAITIANVSLAHEGAASMKVRSTVTAEFNTANFPPLYSVTVGADRGGGWLRSMTSHGLLDHEEFPTSEAYLQSTGSTGDFETTSNVAHLITFPNRILLVDTTRSNSEAVCETAGSHFGTSFMQASVYRSFDVTRTGLGLAPPPEFKVNVEAAAGALHLKAAKEGEARAIAHIDVSLVGTITRYGPFGGEPSNLEPVSLLSKWIEANDEWESPELSGNRFLKLPSWTRLPNASFKLEMGLQVYSYTVAEVVPEPASMVALATGLGAIVLRRRSRTRA